MSDQFTIGEQFDISRKTGHSLGCGLSTLAVPDVMTQRKFDSVEHYNFASPRVGSLAFQKHCVNTTFLRVHQSGCAPHVIEPASRNEFLFESPTP